MRGRDFTRVLAAGVITLAFVHVVCGIPWGNHEWKIDFISAALGGALAFVMRKTFWREKRETGAQS